MKRSTLPAWVFATALFFLIIAGGQFAAGAASAGFGAYPDEASHFLSGLMIGDYLSHLGCSPMAFAKEYYTYQPFFAIGYWPPLFYVLEGLWIFLFGHTRLSLMILVGGIALMCTLTIFGFLRRTIGFWWALPVATLFLLLPSVRWSSTVVMTDLAVTLVCLLATLAFGQFFEAPMSYRWAVLAGFLVGLAMLTKYLAAFVVLAPVLVVFIDRRWSLLARRQTWLIPAVCAAICGPWLWWSYRFLTIGVDGAVRDSPGIRLATVGRLLFDDFGWLIGGLAVASVLWVFGHWNKLSPTVRLLALQPFCATTFLVAAPAGIEPRYFIPFYAPWLMTIPFFLRGILPAAARDFFWVPLTLSAVVALFPLLHPGVVPPLPDRHLRSIALDVVHAPSGPPLAILVPTPMEGAMIAELAAAVPQRSQMIMVRPSKLFARVNWLGTRYELITRNLNAISRLFEELPIDTILMAEPAASSRPHDILLREMVLAPGSEWSLQHFYPASGDRSVALYTRAKSNLSLSKLLGVIQDQLPTNESAPVSK